MYFILKELPVMVALFFCAKPKHYLMDTKKFLPLHLVKKDGLVLFQNNCAYIFNQDVIVRTHLSALGFSEQEMEAINNHYMTAKAWKRLKSLACSFEILIGAKNLHFILEKEEAITITISNNASNGMVSELEELIKFSQIVPSCNVLNIPVRIFAYLKNIINFDDYQLQCSFFNQYCILSNKFQLILIKSV